MGLFDGCLLACDIDGTLVIDGYINPKNIEKIEFFMREGGHFSLCTGRSIGAISGVLEKLKKVSPSLVANGCMLYDHEKGAAIYEKYLPECDYRIAKIVYNCGINAGIEIHSGENVLTVKRTLETDEHQAYEGLESNFVSFEDACGYKWNKAIYLFDCEEDRKAVEKIIANEKSDCDFIETCAEFGGRIRYYYEQVPKGASKASTLLKLCEILGIKREGVFAIGDYYNDVEMLKTAEISAVPDKSPDDVKQYADYITVDCQDGAVADFIDYLTGLKCGS